MELGNQPTPRTNVHPASATVIIALAFVAAGAVAWYFLKTDEGSPGAVGAPGTPPVSTRARQTTIQTASLDVDKVAKAVQVWYLDMPFGPVTFGHLEKGDDQYYSKREWPFAHLKLGVRASYDGKALEPGDYVLIITPKGLAPEMRLSIASFTPGPDHETFLVAGDVLSERPPGASVISEKPVKFASGAQPVDHLVVDLAKAEHGADINIHYGDRTLVQPLEIKQ